MIEVVYSFETSVNTYDTTQCHKPEDQNINLRLHEISTEITLCVALPATAEDQCALRYWFRAWLWSLLGDTAVHSLSVCLEIQSAQATKRICSVHIELRSWIHTASLGCTGFMLRDLFGERKKDLLLLKINLSEESEEDWTILYVLSSSLTFPTCSRKLLGFQLDAYDPAASRYTGIWTLCFTRAITLMYCIKCSQYLGRFSCFSVGRILKLRGRCELHGGYSVAVWDTELRDRSSLRLLLLLLLLLLLFTLWSRFLLGTPTQGMDV
jgi:hypothetical protein